MAIHSKLLLGCSFAVLYILRKFIKYYMAIQSIQNHPGYRILIPQDNPLSYFLKSVPGITAGTNHLFIDKHRMFEYYGSDIHSMVAGTNARVTIVVADSTAIKEIVSSRSRFPKPAHEYTSLKVFGSNIIASEGEEWKKHRKIAAPAFSDKNNKLVWDETIKIMESLFTDVWGDKGTILVDHGVQLTLPIALYVIGVAGFGHSMSWKDEDIIPVGHQLSYKDALHTVTTNLPLTVILPSWAFGLTQHTRNVRLALDEFTRYMKEMIAERRSAHNEVEKYDLFSSLLEASDADSGEATLTISELIGNIFIFLLAGHETTSHTLCFAFALLALYPEEQDILYEHIQSILSRGIKLSYENMPLFTQSMAVFYETLRMFPPVKHADCAFSSIKGAHVDGSHGDQVVVPIPAGTNILLHVPGLHYNPRYWEEPESFRPSRFLGNWPRDAFLPFSAGARGCLGRKFFETEGIAAMTMLVSRYKIELKEEPQFFGETFEQKRQRILRCKLLITLTPINVPLVFKRRQSKPL